MSQPGTAGANWTQEQFWEYADGLLGTHVRDQMRDRMAERGLAIVADLRTPSPAEGWPCPYKSDSSCVLEEDDIGPCLCANPVRAPHQSSGVQCVDVLGPCTQDEIDAFEGLDEKSKLLFKMWVERALKAESDLETAHRSIQEMQGENDVLRDKLHRAQSPVGWGSSELSSTNRGGE